MNKRILSLVLAFAMILGSFSFVAADTFSDVPSSRESLAWAYDEIEYLADLGIVQGHGDGTFTPFSKLTRAQFVTMVNNALEYDLGEELDLADEMTFVDVADGSWYYENVSKALGRSYITGHGGISAGLFTPNSSLTREQAATMVSRAFDLDTEAAEDYELDFTDADELSDWAVPHIKAAAEKDYLIGYPEGDFQPRTAMNRAQATVMLYRILVDQDIIDPIDPEDPEDPEEPVVPVPGTYDLVITTKDGTLVGDGASNTTVEIELVSATTGERDTDLNGLQVRLTTTRGQLADEVVTLQNGYGNTTLNSEAVQRRVDVDLDAQIIETSVPVGYKDNINAMTATHGMVFTAPGAVQQEDIPRLLSAESNQADRVTLIFDRNVAVDEFTDGNTKVTIEQGGTPYTVIGFHRLPGNDPHTVEAILEIGEGRVALNNHQSVDVTLELTRGNHEVTATADFILTDNRLPQVTEIRHDGNMRTLEVWFSEAISEANFSIAGGATGNIINDSYGVFTQARGDNRHIVTLTIDYLEAGDYTLQVSGATDIAGNVGSTQNLAFTVLPNEERPAAWVTVESPEQYRLGFDQAALAVEDLQEIELQMWYEDEEDDDHEGEWLEVTINVGSPVDYPHTSDVSGYNGRMPADVDSGNKDLAWLTSYTTGLDSILNHVVMETNTDWTWVFNTASSGVNYYNHQFRIFIPEDTLVNPANNLRNNEDIILDLPLNRDNTSPVAEDVRPISTDNGMFNIEYNEPVKAIGIEEAEVGETPSQLQHTESSRLPNVVVEYEGTDRDGNTVTIPGEVTRYGSAFGRDNVLQVGAGGERTLRQLVDNECYEPEWTLIVRNVTDDIGNAAVTLEHEFTVAPLAAPARVFEIASAERFNSTVNATPPTGVNIYEYEVVRVQFTDLVRLTGNDDNALDTSNYTINGEQLGNNSHVLVDNSTYTGDNAVYRELCRYDYDGYNAVYILLEAGTLNEGYNILNVNHRLMSKGFDWNPGVQLTGPNEVELDYTWGGPNTTALETEIGRAEERITFIETEGNEGYYTDETENTLRDALEEARIIESNSILQSEIDAATRTLRDAIAGLERQR